MVGTIVGAARRGGLVTAAVRVNEGPPQGLVEYVATVPGVDAQGGALSVAQIEAALIAAWQAQRAGGAGPAVDLSATINGAVNV